MSLASYLAAKYLTAEPGSTTTRKKKRKRGKDPTTSGLIIADDDAALDWRAGVAAAPEPDDTPLTVLSGSAEFRKVKTNAWKRVGEAPAEPAAAAAAQLIAQATAEKVAAATEQVDDAPQVVMMSDGTHAGLQTARAIDAQLEHRRRTETNAATRSPRVEETVYRDATGRRIDLTMRRQEALREAKAKEREKLEEQKGEVQRVAREKRKEELDDAKFMPLTRTIDDAEMNRELKERERWNDPALQFMSQKKNGRSLSGKPLYTGAAAPNRYGIRPGHKWDGVDRSNGWEGHRFKTLNKASRNQDLAYSWQMDE
ncbi:hypothetical protein K3495_g3750 [Podosphaera aphanis]|nr:hypothetical protein K3495_g3750 [Podosphaera aphanis]